MSEEGDKGASGTNGPTGDAQDASDDTVFAMKEINEELSNIALDEDTKDAKSKKFNWMGSTTAIRC
jgi:hypothetical protein